MCTDGMAVEQSSGSMSPAGTTTVVPVCGELDLEAASDLRARLSDLVQVSTQQVIVDLSAVTFCNCAGLHPLREAQAAAPDRLSLRDPSRSVTRVLRLTGLDAVFRIVATDGPGAPRPGGQPPSDTVAHLPAGPARPDGPPRAVRSDSVVEQATGVVMAVRHCSAPQARDLLQGLSVQSGLPLHRLSELITENITDGPLAARSDAVPMSRSAV